MTREGPTLQDCNRIEKMVWGHPVTSTCQLSGGCNGYAAFPSAWLLQNMWKMYYLIMLTTGKNCIVSQATLRKRVDLTITQWVSWDYCWFTSSASCISSSWCYYRKVHKHQVYLYAYIYTHIFIYKNTHTHTNIYCVTVGKNHYLILGLCLSVCASVSSSGESVPDCSSWGQHQR